MAFLIHHNKPSTLDQATRCLLAVPILLALLREQLDIRWLWGGIVVGAISAAGVSIWQVYYLGIERATGFVTSAIPFGNIALVMGLTCAAAQHWASTQGKRAWAWRMALGAGTLAGLYCSLASGSRGGWLALLPIGCLFAVSFLRRITARQMAAPLAMSIIVASALVIAPGTGVQTRLQEVVLEVTNYADQGRADTSVGSRLEIWRATVMSISAKPLLGWDRKSYQQELERLVADENINPYVLELSNTHNNYLEAWLHQGLLGFIALLALIAVPMWSFGRQLFSSDPTCRAIALAGCVLTVGYGVFCLTHVMLGRNNGITFFAMSLAILWAFLRQRQQAMNDPEQGARNLP
ncbi:MAG: O-antigen ligase family protein [Candidimonas sp.]|nr:O-antigen ligase family protein [Candidimonas sp.]